MISIHNHRYRPIAFLLVLLFMLLAAVTPAVPIQAAAPVTTELIAIGDVRIQGGSPDVGFGSGFIWVGTPNGHLALVQFDLLALPANATITSAELRLNFTGTYTSTANVEIGRNESEWDEATVTWNSRPTSTFNGSNIQTVGDTAGEIVWPVTGIVTQWHAGTLANYGFALKGDGPLKAFHSRETSPNAPPRLVVTYTVPPEEIARRDFGDAPDSSNSLGISPNTAYAGVPGNFPTVWAGTPAGQAAGPRHNNLTTEGILGQYISREAEADSGPDGDGANNILNGAADNANNDRGDEGWRNPTATFPHCQTTTLRVRVSKDQNATLDRMFLNVWLDGNRDGDWADRGLCTPENEALAIPAQEWIVQDYFVDLTGIAAGGYVDIDVNTSTILNITPGQRHWLRFTLSDKRAEKAANGRADGRGPHPSATPNSYSFGETEDYIVKPQPAGEDGTLEIKKEVVTGGEPVEWIDYVTYTIRLRHTGGSQPIEARIRDVLPYPLIVYPTIDSNGIRYVDVTSPTGGVAPLNANLDGIPPSGANPPQQVVTWQGTLAPNSELVLNFKVRVLTLCSPNQQTQTITNLATAKPKNGTLISDQVEFLAKCIGYNAGNIEFDPELIENPIDLNDLTHVSWSGEIFNSHPFSATIGLYTPGASLIGQDSENLLSTLTLAPNERRNVILDIPLDSGNTGITNELDLPTDSPITVNVSFCFLFPGTSTCPNSQQFPNLHGQAPPVLFTPRPNDLGDAPDSTNHAAAAMLAYPGVPASYPTVFDPATGLPEGPRHAHPRPFHLGQQVSRETEADLGPDQDPLNNIVPAANNPNNDRFDDGVQPNQWVLTNCQTTIIPVQVLISPAAVNWFQQQNKPGYLNIWADSNRDGDWADATNCGGQPAVEHIVIDQPLNVVALGSGLHTINVPTGLVPWPAAQAQNPAWVRVTLSDHDSNKTLQAGNLQYGDGRGFAVPFKTGETEDYLLRPQDAQPDIAVQLDGRIIAGAGQNGNDRVGFQITYSNQSDTTAQDAILKFTKPAQLRDLEIILLQAPGIPGQNITETDETVTIRLPAVADGTSNTIFLGWQAPANQQPAGDYVGTIEAALTGDTSPDNNSDTHTLTRPAAELSVAIVAGDGTNWGLADTTCRTDIELTGVATAGVPFDLWIDGANVASLSSNIIPWLHPRPSPADGMHEIWVTPNAVTDPAQRSNTLRLRVDPSLPVDPRSLTFTDSQGTSYHPPTLNWRSTARAIAATLQSGETYEIGIDSCVASPNQEHELILPDGSAISLTDLDGDGRYTGSLVFDESGSIVSDDLRTAVTSNDLRLRSTVGGTSQIVTLGIQAQPSSRVLDLASGQPVTGASISALTAANSPWSQAALGQPNPQTSAADGSYQFGLIGGAFFQLVASQNGYQSYRSWDLSTASHVPDIRLSPQIAGPTTYTIAITANGFVPAQLSVPPGSVVEWVNLDLVQHSVSGTSIDSGALLPGQSYRAQVNSPGSYQLTDQADTFGSGVLLVEGGQRRILLPLIVR